MIFDLKISLGGSSLSLFAFSDANWEKTGNCRSRLGSCIFLGYDSGAIFNESSLDTIVSHSSRRCVILFVLCDLWICDTVWEGDEEKDIFRI